MGRPSKLSESQLVEAQRRHIEGESFRAIAKSMGVSESALRERISAQTAQIKTVANQIVNTERAIQALPISAQITAHNLASKLRAISDNLASAAHYGAQTAHRLNALANSEVQKVDDAQPLASVENLKGVAALTKLANDSAVIALNLIAANKDAVSRLNEEQPERKRIDASKVSSQALEELLTARG
jgi:DNA-binding Lrp family transcriptional regulator